MTGYTMKDVEAASEALARENATFNAMQYQNQMSDPTKWVRQQARYIIQKGKVEAAKQAYDLTFSEWQKAGFPGLDEK